MTRLYLVRHGAHDFLGKVLAGRLPGVSLSDAGRVQAERASAFLSELPNNGGILSSPMDRCRETAAPLAARLGRTVQTSEALNEIDYGDWTGATFQDLAADPSWRLWNSDRSRAVVPGGESAQAVQLRAMALIEIYAKDDRMPAVMVSHSDVIKTVALTLLGASLDVHDRLEIEPGSITTIDLWRGGGRIVRLNQVLT